MHLGEYVGEGPVIGLGPAVEWVLVALGAFDPHAQKRRGRALGHRLDSDILAVDEPPPVEIQSRLRRIIGDDPSFSAIIRAASWSTQASASAPSRLVAVMTPRAISEYGMFAAKRLRNQSCHIRARRGRSSSGPSRAATSQPVISRNRVAQSAACIGWASSSSIFLARLSGALVGEEGADFRRRRAACR